MKERPHFATIAVAAGALLGLLFASVSTYDFAMHLDRQVHDVHCSFIPGLDGPQAGESGCQATMVSPYSSVLRGHLWGGVPVSLPAMGIFAFLLFFAVEVAVSGRQHDRRATGMLALATCVPALTSAVMGYIALVELDALCRLCIGIYASSAISCAGGMWLWHRARDSAIDGAVASRGTTELEETENPLDADDPAWIRGRSAPRHVDPSSPYARATSPEPPPSVRVTTAYLGTMFNVGLVFVLLPLVSYVVAAPDHTRFIGTCGSLPHPEDHHDVLVALDPHPGATQAIEILDPLCPACRVFANNLATAELDTAIDRRTLLFPLDATCNWMIDTSLHPGACAISEAILCAGDRGAQILRWAFAEQERILSAAAKDPEAAATMVRERFPAIARCVGSPAARSRINRGLRWAVTNQLPVLTPQLYVGGVKLCDEDVDLGLELALPRMLAAHRAGTLRAADGPEPAAAAAAETEGPEATTETGTDGPEPTTETDGPEPTTETDGPEPTTETDGPEPTTGTDDPQPTTEAEDPEPTTETDDPEPTTETDDRQPTTETDDPEPTTETDDRQPTTETEGPEPTTETDDPEPTAETDDPQPKAEAEDRKPRADSETEGQQPSTGPETDERGPFDPEGEEERQ